MKLVMNQSEVEEAIRAFLGSHFSFDANEKVTVELAATQDADGFEARIEITSEHRGAVPKTTG